MASKKYIDLQVDKSAVEELGLFLEVEGLVVAVALGKRADNALGVDLEVLVGRELVGGGLEQGLGLFNGAGLFRGGGVGHG